MSLKLKYVKYFVTAAAFSVLSGTETPAAPAQEDYFDLSPEQLLSAEVISATKTSETVEKTPAAVYVITAEDIARSGVTSIPDALRMAPGVNVAQGSTGSWSINIRGFNKGLANQLLVMIDGRTIYNPLFAGTYWELQNLPLEDIARIEVVRGPGGTLWGANAVNGVINVITKKAQHTQGVLIRTAAGNHLQDSVLGQVGAKTRSDSYYRVYAQHINYGPLHAPQGGSSPGSLREHRAGFRFDTDDSLTVSGDAYVNTTSQLISVPQITAPYAITQSDVRDSQGVNLLARWSKGYADGSQISFLSYIDHTRRDQEILSDEEDIFNFDAQYNFHSMGPHEVIMGGGYRLNHAVIGNTPTLSINPAVSNRSLFNIFAQDKIELMPESLFLTLGSKIEHNDFTGFEIEPNARLQWFPDKKQTVWAAVSKAVRTPSPLENNLNLNAAVFPPFTGTLNSPLPVEFNLIANPHFDSERLIAYEAGYRNRVTPALSADIALFANNYSGLAAQQFAGLSAVPAVGIPQYFLFQTRQANLMSAETYGIEVAADWNIRPNWKLSGGASFLEMFLHLNNDFANLQAGENQSPRQQYNLRSYWDINEEWTLDTTAYYVGKLPAFGIPSHIRLDANLGWKIKPGIQLNFVGQNMLEQNHMEYGSTTDLNASEVPRSYYMKITCNF